MKKKLDEDTDTMRDEYHFDYSNAVTGKYFRRITETDSNSVIIQPDVLEVFPDSDSVNEALRQVIALGKLVQKRRPSKNRKAVKPLAKGT